MQLGLAMYGSRLAGFATTTTRSSAPALTFLMELRRGQQAMPGDLRDDSPSESRRVSFRVHCAGKTRNRARETKADERIRKRKIVGCVRVRRKSPCLLG